MQAAKLIKYLEKKFNPKLAAVWDKSGVQLYNNAPLDITKEIHKVLICLDLNEAVLNDAIKNNYDFIITRHPFIFNELEAEKKAKKKLFKIIEDHELLIYSIHTNYDASPNQNLLDLVDDKMKIKKQKRFGSNNEGYEIRLKTPLSPSEFISNLEEIFMQKNIQVNDVFLRDNSKIEDFYLISGTGGSEIVEQHLENCLFVTGECKWNEAVYASDNNVKIILLGHYMEERFVDNIYDLVTNSFNDLMVEKYDIKNKIFNYHEVKNEI